jgi:outer membrane lipoprotein-sorting protein
VNILRRLPLSRLLLVCALVIVTGVSASALALALGSGPVPPPKPLAVAVHDALAAPPVEGFSATVKLTNRLVEGVSLASGGGGEASQLSSSPLLSGATGRVWIAKDGRVRLELQAEKGDTEIYYDGHTVSLFDASTNTVYRYVVPSEGTAPAPETPGEKHEVPSLAKIEEAISHLKQHANVSDATPSDVAGQPTYTVRVSPNEGGSLIGGAELSWGASNGVPLRAAVYSTTSSSPVIELAAMGEVSFSPVEASVFEFKPPAGAKIHDVKLAEKSSSTTTTQPSERSSQPTVKKHGRGIGAVVVIEDKTAGASHTQSSTLPEGLPKVKINGQSATELPTALGTLLAFERSGVRYVVGGFVAPSTVEEVARGL